jgi:nucleotide-binding universal stress UspA family protein
MFKHILLPTDGSKLSDRAVTRGIQLAGSLGAKITLLSVVPEFRMFVDETFAVPMSLELQQRYGKAARARTEKTLATISQRAAKSGLKTESVVIVSDLPYQQIINTARKRKCDLIVMASHGRRGLSGLLLGSETIKVLTHGKIPVLVVR